ncbi:hypothetical protein [Mariniphaga sp.]|uniref:hypothetical protein n=1 Tax=Mariniphaga sp. TaxID=1954475 RepID=UPI003562EED1
MKTFLKIFFFAALFGLLAGCEKTGEFFENETPELKKAQVEVTVPFKADFVGNYLPTSGVDVEMCGDYPMIRIFNEGGGTGTHLGKFTHYFDFCVNNETGEYPFGHIEAYFVAANGDKLFVSVAGQVLNGKLDYHPEDVNSYFKDPFVILGGTGKFEGATGNGWTDDYNRDSYPENSFHHWAGEITLVKGKK